MRRGLLQKIFSGYLIVILVLLITLTLFLSRFLFSFYITQLNERLHSIAKTIEHPLYKLFNADKGHLYYEEIEKYLKEIAESQKLRITVIDHDGTVLYDNEMDYKLMDNHLNRAEVSSSVDDRYGYSVRRSTSIKQRMLYHSVSVKDEKGSNIIGFIRISVPVDDVYHYVLPWIYKIFLLGGFSAGISLLLAFFISRGISKKISDLKNFFDSVPDKGFDERLISKFDDELWFLHSSINRMMENINDRLAEKSSSDRNTIFNVLEHIGDCIVIINKDNEISYANKAFSAMFGIEQKNQYYWEVFRDSDLNSFIENCIRKKKELKSEIRIRDRECICSSVYMKEFEEIFLLIDDITDLKNFENRKREFYTNISHELKTPITAIKGFAETLAEESEKEHKNYAEIIVKHADRLNNIVRDLATITDLEQSDRKSDFRNTDLKVILENVISLFMKALRQKGIKISLDIDENNLEIYGDSNKLEQLFINLIDNAVKYTQKGEITVSMHEYECECQETDEITGSEMIRIVITDTGIGINKADLPRIFERFFVADRSRSKIAGGSGLGLAIAKKIVELHGGTITAESTLNKGTSIVVNLPKK